MGILDLPLISEMEEAEKKARAGDTEAARWMVFEQLPTIRRVYIRRLMSNNPAMTLQEAMAKAGVKICVR